MNFRSEVWVAIRDRLMRPDLLHSMRQLVEADSQAMEMATADDVARKLTEAVLRRFGDDVTLPHGMNT